MRVSVCVCVCVCLRERDCMRLCERVKERMFHLTISPLSVNFIYHS